MTIATVVTMNLTILFIAVPFINELLCQSFERAAQAVQRSPDGFFSAVIPTNKNGRILELLISQLASSWESEPCSKGINDVMCYGKTHYSQAWPQAGALPRTQKDR